MRVGVVMGLLVLLVAVVAAQKTKEPKGGYRGIPTPPIADGKNPPSPHHGQHHPGSGGHPAAHGGKHGQRKHHKSNQNGYQPEGKSHEGAVSLKEEIMRIKSSGLPEEEKEARLQALRQHVKAGQMMQHMPPEVRTRHQDLQTSLEEIYQNTDLTEEEKSRLIAEEKAKFKTEMDSLRESMTSEQLQRMREERKKTIEGHTAAAMAAKQAGLNKMAREYHHKARQSGQGEPTRRRRSQRRPSLSEPNFF